MVASVGAKHVLQGRCWVNFLPDSPCARPLVWSWDPEGLTAGPAPSRAHNSQAEPLRERGTARPGQGFQAQSRRTCKICFLSLWNLFCL